MSLVSKRISIDLSRGFTNAPIVLHEGDVSGADIKVSVYNNNAEFDLTGCTVTYDAVVGGYLAEEDASASFSSNIITVPVTENMTATNGLLKIDVKIAKNNQILYFQTIQAQVDRCIINGAVVIDISGTTIAGKFAALEAKFPVDTSDIADGAVTSEKIASGVIPTKISQLENDGVYRRLAYVSEASSYTPTVLTGISGPRPSCDEDDIVFFKGALWKCTDVSEQSGGGYSYELTSIGLAISKLYNDGTIVSYHEAEADPPSTAVTDKYPIPTLWYNTSTSQHYLLYARTETLGTFTYGVRHIPRVSTGASAPSIDGEAGDFYTNISDGSVYLNNGTDWVSMAASSDVFRVNLTHYNGLQYSADKTDAQIIAAFSAGKHVELVYSYTVGAYTSTIIYQLSLITTNELQGSRTYWSENFIHEVMVKSSDSNYWIIKASA